MKYILTVLMLWGVAQAQNIPGYTVANHRYKYLALGSDAFNLPAMGTPALATAQWVRAGALVYDSTGGNRGVHMWTGSAWIRLVDTTQNIGAELEVGVTPVTGGTTTRVLYNNGGTLGEYTTTGSGTVVALGTAPSFTTRITTPVVDGSTLSAGELQLNSTSHATKGFTRIGAGFHFDEVNTRLGIGASTPTASLHMVKTIANAWFLGSNYAQMLFGSNVSTDAFEFYKPADGAMAMEHNGKDIVMSIGNGSYSGVNGIVLKGATGRVGIGTNTPSAWLHLARAGTTAVPSVLLAESAKTTTAVDGAIEKDDAFYLTKTNAVRYGVGGTLTSIYTTVGNVGTGEDNLHSYSIPAGTLSQDGDWIEFEMTFNTPVSGGTIKIYYGATQLGAISANSGFPTVVVRGTIMRTGAATQRASFVYLSGTGSPTPGYLTPTETLSGAVTLRATAEATSNNDITQVLTTVKFFPAN